MDKARYVTGAVGTFFGIKFASVSGAAFKVHRITLHFEVSATQQHDRT